MRSGRAHGHTVQPPHNTLARIRVVDGCVSTDADTGQYLAELVAGEARWLCSPVNAVPGGVARHLAHTVLADADPSEHDHIAAMTDDEFWARLITDPRTATHAHAPRRDPAGWTLATVEDSTSEGFTYEVQHLYLDMPLVDGTLLPASHPAFDQRPVAPWQSQLHPPRVDRDNINASGRRNTG